MKYSYIGVSDCRAAVLLYGGSKECVIGCLGLGTCVSSCPFDALSMGEDNLPVVNKDRCTSCGICAEVCPKSIITVTSAAKRILSDYKVSECTAPCQRTCPAEIDIPAYIRHITDGDYLGAVRVIKEKNPFPLVCGHLCPAPCESECRRNFVDEPVTINALKKFVAGYERKTGERAQPNYLPPASGKKIAVIGGGVEGLTASYYLRRLGHQPKIFEVTGQLGGILRYVIDEERLPRDVLDWDIDGILETGVDVETGKQMGKDFTLSSLFDTEFDMALLTAGGWDSRQIMRGRILSESMIPNTNLLLDLLIGAARGEKKELPGKVVIVGGGKTTAKAAEVCFKSGAEEVIIVYPYSKDETEYYDIDLAEIKRENVFIYYSSVPMELRGEGDQLSEITIRTDDGSVKDIPLDHLIVGSGRLPEMLIVKEEENKWKTVEIFKVLPREPDMGIFDVGEKGRPTDQTAVVTAVRRGRKVVRAVHLHVTGEEVTPETGAIITEAVIQNVTKGVAETDELEYPRKNITNLTDLTGEESLIEAKRCLDCGLICYKKHLDLPVNKHEKSAT